MLVLVEKDGEQKQIQSEDVSLYTRRYGYKVVTEETPKKKGKKLSEDKKEE